MDAQALSLRRRAAVRADPAARSIGVDALMQRIAAEYEALPRQLKNVASYVEQHRANLMVDRATDIAARCAVQPSAVVRFAQRFGFSGFSEMQGVFRQAYTEQTSPTASYQERIRTLIGTGRPSLSGGALAREFFEASRYALDELARDFDEAQFDAAVGLLQRAENIYVAGVRRSFPVAGYIAYALQHTNKRVHLISGIGGMYREQMRSIGRNDAVVAISAVPYGKETQLCVRLARRQGAGDHRRPPLAAGVRG
jgi:DNA-binding MurR/RpiR family transcriptional regulator